MRNLKKTDFSLKRHRKTKEIEANKQYKAQETTKRIKKCFRKRFDFFRNQKNFV